MHLLHLDDIQLPTLSTLVKGAKVEVVKIEFWKSLGIGRSCNRRILLRMTFGCISFNIFSFGGEVSSNCQISQNTSKEALIV